jgi:hypothetical protein
MQTYNEYDYARDSNLIVLKQQHKFCMYVYIMCMYDVSVRIVATVALYYN